MSTASTPTPAATNAADAGSSTTTQVYRVYIKATAQAVWDAITNPAWTQRYGYAGAIEVDLRRGGAFLARPSAAMLAYCPTTPDPMIVGEVIESDPPRKLVQTWHPVWDPQSAAEQPTVLTYEIEEERGVSRLTVIHDLAGAPIVAKMVSGQVREAGGGWAYVLSDLKTLLETGHSFAIAS
jgi:uncharacterized protein YndB with AHSA1/START domain